MNKIMMNGEYLSMETAERIALLTRENKHLRHENVHLGELYQESYKSFEKLFKRVNKAIDYINKNEKDKKIIEILKGIDENEK